MTEALVIFFFFCDEFTMQWTHGNEFFLKDFSQVYVCLYEQAKYIFFYNSVILLFVFYLLQFVITLMRGGETQS